MFKYLFILIFSINLFADVYYCSSNQSATCFHGGSQVDLYSSDFKTYQTLKSDSQKYYPTYSQFYDYCSGCISRVNFETINQQFDKQRNSLNTDLYNCQTSCNGNDVCNNTCQSNYDNKINEVKTNLNTAVLLADGSKCNEIYYDYDAGGVINCNPNTGEKSVIPNASISPTGDLSCGSGYYASSLPNLVIGGSGYNWNTQNCVSKVHNEEIEGGGTITTNFDDNGQIESATYNNGGYSYTLTTDSNGNLIGVIKDSTGNIVESGTVDKDDTGNYNYTSNNSGNTSLNNTPINDFYKYTPTSTGGTGGTGTGGTGTNTNNTNIDGLNQNYVTPTNGTGGNSQTDVMNNLKQSLDANTQALQNNANSNDSLTGALNSNGVDSQAQAIGDSSYFGMSGLVSDIQGSYASFNQSINDTKSIFENGLVFQQIQMSSNVTRCLQVHVGNTFVKFDFISVLAKVKPFFQMFFQIFFLFLTIKITLKTISVMRGA